jgi:hypothetical protein
VRRACLDSQKLRGISTHDEILMLRRIGELFDKTHGLLVAHVETIVAAEHQPVDPTVLNEEVEHGPE